MRKTRKEVMIKSKKNSISSNEGTKDNIIDGRNDN